jgi:hypothetical protein
MSITISDLVSLIEACGKAGVKKFVHETEKGLPINLEFFEQKVTPEIPVFNLPEKEHISDPKPKNFEVSHNFSVQEELRLLEEDYDILPIADPEKYEELLANGKLESYGDADA